MKEKSTKERHPDLRTDLGALKNPNIVEKGKNEGKDAEHSEKTPNLTKNHITK